MQRLTELKAGSSGVIARMEVPLAHRARLLEMGLLVGTPVDLVRFAPLGDPVELRVRGYHLTLRRGDADGIWVTPR